MQKAALISVSDRTGIIELAQALVEQGYILLTTSGSGKYLSENGIQVRSIEEYTGQAEILDGRVKTLHPKIHAGLLARHDNTDHLNQLKAQEIYPIEVAAINLYPFIQNLSADAAKDPSKMVELVDIGGPTMIRAAAKNFYNVLPLIDPSDYPSAIDLILSGNLKSSENLSFRSKLATKVFTNLSNYNLQIAKYFSNVSYDGSGIGTASDNLELGDVEGQVLLRSQILRYGENPHQKASFYTTMSGKDKNWKQLNGKELSYNNLLDFTAAFRLLRKLPMSKAACVIIKHLNPCGVALAETPVESVKRAKQSDPRSHFGGIIACNKEVDCETAEELTSDFVEIVLAPSYSYDALNILKKKKNIRVIEVELDSSCPYEFRSVEGGILKQETDSFLSCVREGELVTGEIVSEEQWEDIELAWAICSCISSNAICFVRNGQLVGSGSGQMSRIDATNIAIMKANEHKHTLKGAVAASDAFFPFQDSIEKMAGEGISAVIAPCGSRSDGQITECAKELGINLIFTNDRHFRH